MSADFEDYGLAHKMVTAIRKLIRDEVTKSRPKASYAVVLSIDPDDKSCVVLFPGGNADTDGVRVPYTSVVPSQDGQTVRIGGSANDRYIEAVMGTTDDLARIEIQEDEMKKRAFIAGRWRLESNVSMAALGTIPIQSNNGFGAFDPVGGLTNQGGRVKIPVSGYYTIKIAVSVQPGDSTNKFTLAVNPNADINAQYSVVESISQHISGDGGNNIDLVLMIDEMIYLNAGDEVLAKWIGAGSTTVYAIGGYNGAARTTLQVKLDYAAEKYVAPTT